MIDGKNVIALLGQPNSGKSTVFNNLTGMHQHTGNWTGKTVENAVGMCTYQNKKYLTPDSYDIADRLHDFVQNKKNQENNKDNPSGK